MQSPVLNSSHPAATPRKKIAPNDAILCRLQRGQLLSLDAASWGGLIILKTFYVDFAGPGAAVGGEFDRHCTAVYAIGQVQLQIPSNRADQEQVLLHRIAQASSLAKIANIPGTLQRSCRIVEQLCQWLPAELAETIPAELIGKMVAVSPLSVHLAWQSRKHLSPEMPTLVTPPVPFSEAL